MLGDFITRILVLVLGYAYPAFECYKTVEKNRVEIEELRFWCQYWILVALIACFERIGDILISWLPFYGEMKVVFFVYLWYPKTKGTGYVYQTLLRPYIAKHETEIDRKIMEMRARAWDFFVYYWQNCAYKGQNTLTQAFQYFVAQSIKVSNPTNQKVHQKKTDVAEPEPESEPESEPEPEPQPVNRTLSTIRSLEKQASKGRKWPPPTPPPTPSRSTTDSPRATPRFRHQTEATEDISALVPDNIPGSPVTEARARLRRTKLAHE